MLVATSKSRFAPRAGIADFNAGRRRGMGDAASPIVNQGIQGAGIATSALALIPATGPFAPFAAIGVGLFSLFSNVFGLGSGCGQTCIAATKVVNTVEPYLQQNLKAYQAGGHTKSEQATALKVFDAAWADAVQGCSNPALGSAGQRCISERQAGGSAPWCPTKTGCDWFSLYRDPIANDPNVVPDPVPISMLTPAASPGSASQPIASIAGADWTSLLVPAALVGLGVAFIAGSSR